MAYYLLCLTTRGGVPLFTRTEGDLKPLPFPVIGSLNGIHMFASTHDVSLLSTSTDDSKIVWKVFHESITLILVSQEEECNDCHLNRMLETISSSLVLLCGVEEVQTIKNVERFKKELKVCYGLVDHLLQQTDKTMFCGVTGAVDVLAAPENALLQNFLDAFVEAADSPYGCLFVHGKTAVATKKWWNLTAVEQILLAALIKSSAVCSARDIPIFLPDGSPKVPHRLMSFQLMKNIIVCVICGPTPSLATLEPEVTRFWKSSYDSLKSLSQLHPRNFPNSITVDSNILGFLLVNTEINRCLSSIQPSSDLPGGEENLSITERSNVLCAFYKKTVGTFFSTSTEGSEKGPSEFSHKPMDTYITTDTYKCYAMQSESHQIYILFSVNIPTFAMRSVTNKTFKLLSKDKIIQI
ncbi:hypothetical protein ScPMuIL_015072 [Solemya velum]